MSTIDGKKISPKKTEELEQALIDYRGGIARAEEFISLETHPGWKAFMEDVEVQMEGVEITLHNFDKLDHDARTINLQKMRDLRWLRKAVERVKSRLPKLHQDMNACQTQLTERKARGASVNA